MTWAGWALNTALPNHQDRASMYNTIEHLVSWTKVHSSRSKQRLKPSPGSAHQAQCLARGCFCIVQDTQRYHLSWSPQACPHPRLEVQEITRGQRGEEGPSPETEE